MTDPTGLRLGAATDNVAALLNSGPSALFYVLPM